MVTDSFSWSGQGQGISILLKAPQVVVTCSWSLGPLFLSPHWVGRTRGPPREQPGLGPPASPPDWLQSVRFLLHLQQGARAWGTQHVP